MGTLELFPISHFDPKLKSSIRGFRDERGVCGLQFWWSHDRHEYVADRAESLGPVWGEAVAAARALAEKRFADLQRRRR